MIKIISKKEYIRLYNYKLEANRVIAEKNNRIRELLRQLEALKEKFLTME